MGEVEENFPCPSCGMVLVSRRDVYCKRCGAKLSEFVRETSKTASAEAAKPEEVYERKFSMVQRFLKLLVSPSDAMEDIALAPSYEGIVVIGICEFVLVSVTMAMALSKVQISGPNSGEITNLLTAGVSLAVFLAFILFFVRWAIKSLIVKYLCDNGSAWDFATVASVTGYAYIADIIVGLLGLFVGWLMTPTFYFDTTDLEAARQTVNDVQAEVTVYKLMYTLPLSLLGLLWKSYLGGLGAHFGTEKKCSIRAGITVFFGLGLIGLLISFAL